MFLSFFLTASPVVAGLLIAGTVFIHEEDERGKKDWEAYRAAAEKRGTKLFIKDFLPPDIPDEQNYAAVPAIREMFVKKDDDKETANLARKPSSHAKMPKWPNDITGQRFDAAGWQEFFLAVEAIQKKSDSPERDILSGAEKDEPLLQELRNAALRPKCKFQTHWEIGVATPMPHFSKFQKAARMFSVKAGANLALGENAEALGELRQVIRLYEAVRTEPTLIAGLVRISFLSICESIIWDGLAGGRWRDEELAVLEEILGKLNLSDDCRFSIASERGFTNAAHMEFARRGYEMLEETTKPMRDLGIGHEPPVWQRLVINSIPSGLVFQLMVHTNRHYDWLLSEFDSAAKGNASGFPPVTMKSSQWLATNPPPLQLGSFFEDVGGSMYAVIDSVLNKSRHLHTRTQETRLACALERYRHAQGAFPDTLERLVPKFVPALPADMFDGKPLRYRVNPDGGYDLWSIGPDGKDDGGKIDPKENNGQSQKDWIWHMPGPVKTP